MLLATAPTKVAYMTFAILIFFKERLKFNILNGKMKNWAVVEQNGVTFGTRGQLVTSYWGTFSLLVFKVIWGSFGALAIAVICVLCPQRLCGAWEFHPKGLWLYGRRGCQVCMQTRLSWMVKANEYKKPVNLVTIAINWFI